MPKDTFKVQNRGGKGIKGMNIIDNDIIDEIFLTNTHNFIMFFTNMGRVYRMKGYEIPESGRNARGVAIVNLLHKITSQGTAVIMSTHNLPLLDKFPGIVYRCDDGELLKVEKESAKDKEDN